jgi:glucose-6-phosphate 1-dehydrogenase
MSDKNCAIIIIGASGDLAKRKLVPALLSLAGKGRLDAVDCVVGVGRSFFTDESFRERFSATGDFAGLLFYHQYISGLKAYLVRKGDFRRVVFFLAQPPEAYCATAKELLAEGFGRESSIIIEKPFGYDYESARTLNRGLLGCFDESQIFRIDHYLAKEPVQNILVFRFANALFSPVWNSGCIESIQINALEEIGVMERGPYFDKAGIIRDMVQNHLLQLLSLLTMEAPATLDPHDLCLRKTALLESLSVTECHRYQYNGYRREKGIAEGSTTETFAELKLSISNERWSGTPVYIRTGKAVNRHGTEIGVRLRNLPRQLYNSDNGLEPNRILFKIQPSEGIIIDLSSRVPDADGAVTGTHMNFCYRDSFAIKIPEAYEKLLSDAIKGDRTLFVCSEETETAWKILGPILDKGDLGFYDTGTMPASKLGVDWIDFEKYAGLCG